MRIRTIKPEFWEDEVVASCRRDARLLFIATWNLADDEGLLRWSPEYLKASAFMYDDDISARQVVSLMEELVDAGLVFPYRGGRAEAQLGWIVNFLKHQRLNRPTPSKLPAPSLQNPDVRQAYGRRDGWVCQICFEEIARQTDLGNEYDGGRAPHHGLSLDHKTPRLHGGSDYPSNIRATHGGCNSGRRDYITEGDLPDAVSNQASYSLSDSVSDSSQEGKGKEGKREEEGKGKDFAPPAQVEVLPPGRSRDFVWEVLIEIFGEPTATAHGAYNAAAKTLRDYGADPNDIRTFVALCRTGRNDWAVKTPTALAKHYGSRESLIREPSPAERIAAMGDLVERRLG